MKEMIRDVPDFPKKGIIFKDITPLLGDPFTFQKTINTLKDRYADKQLDAVVGVEARGFIFASALAYALGIGVVMIRKPGKLPYKKFQETYSLEYGTDTVEVHYAGTLIDGTEFDIANSIALPARKGDMVVLHGRLPHASEYNRSDRSRHAYTLHVVDGACDYPENNWLQRHDDMPLRGFER